MIDLRTLQCALGGEISNGQLSCPGPSHSPRDRSMTVRPLGDDFIVFSHAGDDWQTCKDHVRQRLGLPAWQPGDGCDRRVDPSQIRTFDRAAVDAESQRRERTADDLQRIERAVAIWDAGVSPRGTVAESYLDSRALTLDDDVVGRVLRYCERCPWRCEITGSTVYLQALIASFRSIDDDAVTAVHRIRLDQPQRWPKAERRMLGVVQRAAVKLDPLSDTLHIGEGVETCLAARQLGHVPAWALGSVGMISHFPLIDGVKLLRILGEAGTASATAIKLCGQRWHVAGRRVQIIMPADGCDDLNDEIMAASA
jgi:hypothetical protein